MSLIEVHSLRGRGSLGVGFAVCALTTPLTDSPFASSSSAVDGQHQTMRSPVSMAYQETLDDLASSSPDGCKIAAAGARPCRSSAH